MHIAILTGGISTEREVALRSGANMKDWVTLAGYTYKTYDLPNEIDRFLMEYKKYDLVIPVFHGMYGEDGQITAFLKTLGCRYAYSPFETHALCMDKYHINLLVERLGIHVPRTLFITEGHSIENLVSPLICYPVIIKPNRGGSSIATTKAKDTKTLITAQGLVEDDDILIQECIEGREFTVGVYSDRSGYYALPIMEVLTGERVFDYAEKYESDGSNEIFPTLTTDEQEALEDMSTSIAKTIGTRGVVRIDWRYDGRYMYFLEVNTIPGFTAASIIPKMWRKAGKTEKEFVDMLNN